MGHAVELECQKCGAKGVVHHGECPSRLKWGTPRPRPYGGSRQVGYLDDKPVAAILEGLQGREDSPFEVFDTRNASKYPGHPIGGVHTREAAQRLAERIVTS